MAESLSAAELQSRHELEGAPDPFPEFGVGSQVSKSRAANSAAPDVTSDEAFPSLASNPSSKPAAASAWGAGAGPRIKAATQTPLFAESFTITSMDLSKAGKDGKPTTLGEILKEVMKRHKVKIESSTNIRQETTFALKSESEKELDKAKRTLLALLSPIVTLTVNAPISTIPSIIGAKGANLKQIRDQTNVKIDIPRRDSLATSGSVNASGVATPAADGDDEDDEPTVPITITGPQTSAYDAQELINQAIAQRRSATTRRVKDIPAHVFPFIKGLRSAFEAAAGDSGTVTLTLDGDAREIVVFGDRAAVLVVVDRIKATVAAATAEIQHIKLSLPKRQHRLLVGSAVDEIIQKSKCSVTVPGPDVAGDEVTVWGKGADLPQGLAAVMEKANSQYIHEFPLPGPAPVSKQIATYLNRIEFANQLAFDHQGVEVFTPTDKAIHSTTPTALSIELVGEKASVDAAVRKVSELIAKLIGGTRGLEIDWLIHRVLQGTKNAKKLKQFHEAHNVRVYFPPEDAEVSFVILVYDPTSPAASPNPAEKAKHLNAVEKELLKIASEAADVKTEVIAVEQKWHESVIGQNGTTLNALIGEDKSLSIKFGKETGQDTDDVIVVRGPRADVEKTVAEINKIVEDAKNDLILSSYSTKFDIDQEYVGRIVGSGGAAINRIRDSLGVKIDFDDDSEKVPEGKKKKTTSVKAHVTITGRKENVEDAKKRILAQVERLADETQEVLKVPAQYHSALIGQGGKYAIRLEERHGVKITFPRHSENSEGRTREQLKADEVLVKGGRKGVAEAKKELMEALEFEKQANQVISFEVPTRSVPRILGKGGVKINEIKEDHGVSIDVDKGHGEKTTITITGHKKEIEAAKAAILEISDSVHEETTDSVTIENQLHRTIIGPGGQGLRDLIARVGGPSDSRQQAGLIRFPRQGETGDEIKLRGEPKLVAKLKAELEKIAADLRDRIVVAVAVPAAQHRALIGRGGQNLNDMQKRTGAQIQFPGSRSYNQVGEPINATEFTDVDPSDIVKVSGSKAACEKATEELKAAIKSPKAPKAVKATPTEELSVTINVPLKYHHVISQQGSFFRQLRSTGVSVDNPVVPQKSAVPTRPSSNGGAPAARIDDDGDFTPDLQWQVILNYQDAEEGDSEWTLRSRDQGALDRAQKRVEEAIENAAKMTHVGFLTMPDNSMFPRIVGTKGSNVQRLRDETGADITLGKNDPTITIIGSESALEHAREEIVKMTSGRGRRGD